MGKKITIGVCGGIAIYKVASLISYLKDNGNEIKVIMTEDAAKMMSPIIFETLSKNKVIIDMFGNEEDASYVSHIHFAQDVDFMIIAPATANIIGKAANGIADDMLSSTIIASNKPIIFIPAMNTYMYENPIVQSNIEKLKGYGYHFIEPDTGKLACDVNGKGKYPDTKRIVKEINEIIGEISS